MDYAVPAAVADGSRNANGQAVHFIKALLLIYSLTRTSCSFYKNIAADLLPYSAPSCHVHKTQ